MISVLYNLYYIFYDFNKNLFNKKLKDLIIDVFFLIVEMYLWVLLLCLNLIVVNIMNE